MKKLMSILAVTALIFVGAGCATTTASKTPEEQLQIKAARMSSVAELAVFTGATVWLREHPADLPYFCAAQVALGGLLTEGGATPEKLQAALRNLPVGLKELKGENGALIIGAALILYDGYVREHVNLDANAYLRPVIAGIYSGVTRAINATPH